MKLGLILGRPQQVELYKVIQPELFKKAPEKDKKREKGL